MRRALSVAGGEQKLAFRLEVTPGELSSWVRGLAAPPQEVFLKAARLIRDEENATWRRRTDLG